MLRLAALAALTCALPAFAAPDGFDKANKYLAENSFKRACTAFAEVLKAPDVDLCDQFQPALWGLLDILPKKIPVVRQRNNRQTAHGEILTDEEAG